MQSKFIPFCIHNVHCIHHNHIIDEVRIVIFVYPHISKNTNKTHKTQVLFEFTSRLLEQCCSFNILLIFSSRHIVTYQKSRTVVYNNYWNNIKDHTNSREAPSPGSNNSWAYHSISNNLLPMPVKSELYLPLTCTAASALHHKTMIYRNPKIHLPCHRCHHHRMRNFLWNICLINRKYTRNTSISTALFLDYQKAVPIAPVYKFPNKL